MPPLEQLKPLDQLAVLAGAVRSLYRQSARDAERAKANLERAAELERYGTKVEPWSPLNTGRATAHYTALQKPLDDCWSNVLAVMRLVRQLLPPEVAAELVHLRADCPWHEQADFPWDAAERELWRVEIAAAQVPTHAEPPLTEREQLVLDYIRQHQPVSGKEICRETGIEQGSLTSQIIPVLKRHGVENRRGAGYFVAEQ